jgi:hypothetical protein
MHDMLSDVFEQLILLTLICLSQVKVDLFILKLSYIKKVLSMKSF